MKENPDYARDLIEIRSMMERSTKFLSLSGLAGVMAGIYALAGAWISYQVLGFDPGGQVYSSNSSGHLSPTLPRVVLLAIAVLILALGTAFYLSWKKATKSGEKFWNATTRRVISAMAVPLIAGGLLILALIAKGLIGYMAPLSLVFYGLALYNAGKFTYEEVKYMGLIEIGLGLFSAFYIEYGTVCWAAGFGLVHIIYGIYLHYKYEKSENIN